MLSVHNEEQSPKLKMTTEQYQGVYETIAVHVSHEVYRQLRGVQDAQELAAAEGIMLGNCCSCSSVE